MPNKKVFLSYFRFTNFEISTVYFCLSPAHSNRRRDAISITYVFFDSALFLLLSLPFYKCQQFTHSIRERYFWSIIAIMVGLMSMNVA